MDSGWSKGERNGARSGYNSACPLLHFENRDDRSDSPPRSARQVRELKCALMLPPYVLKYRRKNVQKKHRMFSARGSLGHGSSCSGCANHDFLESVSRFPRRWAATYEQDTGGNRAAAPTPWAPPEPWPADRACGLASSPLVGQTLREPG